MLQILDDGRLTDSKGKTVDFKNTVIIMTSNIGSSIILENSLNSMLSEKDFEQTKDKVMDLMKEHFKPEFLNRIDEIVIFDSLNKDELLQIIDLMLEDTKRALQDKNINMTITKDAKLLLLNKGTDLKYGARPLRRAIQRYIEDELSEMILRKGLENGQTVEISCNNNEFNFKVK